MKDTSIFKKFDFDGNKWYKNKINNNKTFKMKNENLMLEVMEGIYNNPKHRKRIIPTFMSDPGLNKSTTIKKFAKSKGVNLVSLILSQVNPNEISGSFMPDMETKMMTYMDFDKLMKLKDGDILFIDEVLNSNGMVLNAALTLFMQRQLISGHNLPDIMIVGASNYQGATRLTPQQKERFLFYDLFLDEKGYSDHLKTTYLMPKIIIKAIINLINSEGFTSKEFNYNSARSLDWYGIALMIDGIPTPYSKILAPILNIHIENTSNEDIKLKDGSIFMKGEKKSWLTLQLKDK